MTQNLSSVKPVRRPNLPNNHSPENPKWELQNLVNASIGTYGVPAAVKSLNGHSYVAAHIDDASQGTKLYFQATKSQTFESYKKDEAHIEMQTGNQIKCLRSDQGCYKLFFFFYTCLPCSSLLFFIYDQHAFTSRQTCLLHMSTSFLHYALHMFTSRLTHSLYLFKAVVRQLYSLAFH